MKRICFYCFIVVLVFQLISCVQNKTETKDYTNTLSKSISKDEYDSIYKEAIANTDKKIRREVTTEDRNLNTPNPVKVIITQEFLPPDRSKWVVLETSENSVNRTEIVYIGDFEYRKENSGNWLMKNLKINNKNEEMGITAKKDNRTEEYSKEEVVIELKSFWVLTVKTVNPKMPLLQENKVWIDKEGLIHKKENKISLGKPENLVSSSVTNYDYNVKDIKIEAPISETEIKQNLK